MQKIAVLEGLLNVQKEIESSKKDLDDELFSFVIDYNQIEKNIGLINEWAIKKAPIENFVDNLKNTLFTRVQYKRQELFENCNSLKEKNEKSLRWINDTIKGLSKEGNSAFKNVYLKFLTSQKALLEEQSSKLNIISNKLISPKDLHISQEEFDSEKANIDPLWQKFHLTLYSLNEDSKETIRRNMYSFNASTETKELCKKLLIQGKPLKKLTEAQMASAVSLIQDMQNSRLFKHDYKIAIY
ncbi:MAG: hypothetical protein JSS09_07820 [Verrucomicrobia bacterium]|nr:hypothetical protein [Verrucomicrobiota bacterium]